MAFIEEEGLAPDELARLHALLLSALRQRRGDDPFTAPVTVAEIYQELVPYRSVRTALGIEMNADYEHTLLRLLSGERGLTRIEPQAAAEQLVKELESPNPNVTLYRKFAACDVWLLPAVAGTPEWLAEHLEDEPAVSEPQPELGWDPRKALPDEPATPATAAAKAESQ